MYFPGARERAKEGTLKTFMAESGVHAGGAPGVLRDTQPDSSGKPDETAPDACTRFNQSMGISGK